MLSAPVKFIVIIDSVINNFIKNSLKILIPIVKGAAPDIILIKTIIFVAQLPRLIILKIKKNLIFKNVPKLAGLKNYYL